MRVLVDGDWREGELEAYQQDSDGTWRGCVRWSEGIGKTRIGWLGLASAESDSDDSPRAAIEVVMAARAAYLRTRKVSG